MATERDDSELLRLTLEEPLEGSSMEEVEALAARLPRRDWYDTFTRLPDGSVLQELHIPSLERGNSSQ